MGCEFLFSLMVRVLVFFNFLFLLAILYRILFCFLFFLHFYTVGGIIIQ